jgi:acyl phosphate:glycerol-3-phosphate acyltransferase
VLEASAIIIGYLMGSFPTAYITARIRKGVDIREVGVGNMGAANVFREIGMAEGIFVSIVDLAKGAAAVIVALWLLGEPVPWLAGADAAVFYPARVVASNPWVLGAAMAAIAGHNYPVYLGFRGGKGAATFIGACLAIAWQPSLIFLVILGIAFLFVRRIFVALWFMSPCSPVIMWFFTYRIELVIFILATLIFMGLRTLPNNRGFQCFLAKGKVRIKGLPILHKL